jgi:hypothetical protein
MKAGVGGRPCDYNRDQRICRDECRLNARLGYLRAGGRAARDLPERGRGAGGRDLAFGSHETYSHRVFCHEEGSCDFQGRHADQGSHRTAGFFAEDPSDLSLTGPGRAVGTPNAVTPVGSIIRE